ncbi:hypothetical protein PTTG_02820 [Puccinia triticina 1-1 BBBD Race 1]|uniref:4F5 domain-containing protein n=1 Tax=Puccinia triticina (isolate 1-1 / race 1 (BBBD)) TaxID=630390 RepID=A0A0C4EPW7_PUCT1|nr:hypothetical protein PTTG_02820 [Puccinia triticina 1-1 BBBD Race 1]
MGGGNGAKAAQKRERNAKATGATAKSQLKVNEAAKNIQCKSRDCKAEIEMFIFLVWDLV